MTKYVKMDTSYPYKIDFIVDGEFVSPASATITIRDNAGDVVYEIDQENLTIPENATGLIYQIASGANGGGFDYNIRYIEVKFVYNSVTYTINDFYSIRASLTLPVTFDEVRTVLSATQSELPDDAIDLFLALSEAEVDAEGTDLSNLISTGSNLIPYVRVAIIYKAAINSYNSIKLGLYQSEQADNTLYKRFNNIDFDSIYESLALKYQEAISKILGIEQGGGTVADIFIVSVGTDPITG